MLEFNIPLKDSCEMERQNVLYNNVNSKSCSFQRSVPQGASRIDSCSLELAFRVLCPERQILFILPEKAV